MTASSIRHSGIVVSDMAESLPFYRDLLGLEVWWDRIEEGPLTKAVTGVKGANAALTIGSLPRFNECGLNFSLTRCKKTVACQYDRSCMLPMERQAYAHQSKPDRFLERVWNLRISHGGHDGYFTRQAAMDVRKDDADPQV